MAPNTELQWRRIENFAGLWDNGDFTQMPPNAAQVMSGCHPQLGGGLRAFHKPVHWAGALGGGTKPNPGVTSRVVYAGTTTNGRRLVITAPVDTGLTNYAKAPRRLDNLGLLRFWRRTSGSWTELAHPNTPIPRVNFQYNPVMSTLSYLPDPNEFHLDTVDNYLGLGTTDSGADMLKYVTATNTLAEAGPSGIASTNFVIEMHQSRLVVPFGNAIVFTSPGIYDIPDAAATKANNQFIDFVTSDVSWIVPVPPNDLYIGTFGGGVFIVQGDLSDPVVRTLRNNGTGFIPATIAALASIGPVADLGEGPVLLASDGEVVPLYTALNRTHWVIDTPLSVISDVSNDRAWEQISRGYVSDGPYIYARSDLPLLNKTFLMDESAVTRDTSFVNSFVSQNLLALNGSLVYDTVTGAWFKSVHWQVADILAPWLHTYNRTASGRTVSGIVTIPSAEHAGELPSFFAWMQSYRSPRANIYEWKSAPLNTGDGRQIELRAVQLNAVAHNPPATPPSVTPHDQPGTMVITATNEFGDIASDTISIQTGSPRTYQTQLRMTGTHISVSVKSTSANQIIEAPSLDDIAFGYTEGTVIYDQ